MKSFFEHLSENTQKEYWASLALRSCENCTPRLLRNLLRAYGSAYEVFCIATQSKSSLENFPKEKRTIPMKLKQELRSDKWREKALPEWQMSKKSHGEIILWTDYRYPLGLKQIVDAPPFFYARGDFSLLASPSVAIVGSRKFHPLSLEKAKSIAKSLSAAGICVVSGLAKGIDSAAHLGALSELGKTIAVLGSGIDVVYPKENQKLYELIAEQGLIISEFPPFSKPSSKNFPIRNRLVSALSEGVLVVEAAPKSGSLITARLALEQNRNVYVIRPLDDTHSLGCHSLIQDGAVEIEDALAIITDIAPQLEEKLFSVEQGNTDDNENIPLKKSVTHTTHIPHDEQEWGKNKERASHKLIHAEFSLEDSPQKQKTIQKKGFLEDKATDLKAFETLKPIPRVSSLPFEQDIEQREIQAIEIASFKRRPSFNEDVPSLAIDFGDLSRALMGERQDFSVQDVLVSKKKNPKQTNKKNDRKNKEVSQKNNQPIDYNVGQENDVALSAKPKNSKETLIAAEQKTLDLQGLSPLEQSIMQILHKETNLAPDEILTRLPKESQDISELSMTLLMLEVEGKVQRLSGNRYILA